MRRVAIGIHVYEEPERLLATLESMAANTPPSAELVLLPDGPDSATVETLARLSHIKQSGTPAALGAAACFNRLVSESDCEVLVFIESGCLVGPGWLDLLLSAFELDPAHGLAGPSTNLCWNEQAVFPRAIGTANDVADTSRQAIARFGHEVRTLEPLYSLADFCYAVRREVVAAIGAADERYSLGPCWEMDYNARAARAGFKGVHALAAYVYRPGFSRRRATEEVRRFDASKRLYQDKFCGGRLQGVKTDYRPHCSGGACPNFAPRSLIEIQRPFSSFEPPRSAAPEETQWQSDRVTCQGSRDILVSCIMPTCDRSQFVPRAIDYFKRQDYAPCELLIVDDGSAPVRDLLPPDDRIRYVALDSKLTVGAKRNLACELARGEVIVHWDDDDWYPAHRVSSQVDALLRNNADLCGTSRLLYYKPATDQAWEYWYRVPGSAWVGGNTLCYRKSFWQSNRFHDIQVGEDSRFVLEGHYRTVFDLNDPGLCIATVHSGNTSPKQTNGVFWQEQPGSRVRELLGDDLPFYRSMFEPQDLPLVSCIMPTYNRRAFVPFAIGLFLAQDYPNRELIIIDDGEDKIGELAEGLAGITYVPLNTRSSIGTKRNLGCERACGEIIAHWDDDDWYAANRLRYQVMPIIRQEADITGLENSFVLDVSDGQFWTTSRLLHKRMFVGDVHGGTLVYRRSLNSQGIRYPEINLAEDAYFLSAATHRGYRLGRLPNSGVFVYVRHDTNAWREFTPGRFIDPSGWQRIDRPGFFPAGALDSYSSARCPR